VDGTVLAASTVVVVTGSIVVVVRDEGAAVGSVTGGAVVGEATTRGVPCPAKAQAFTPANPSSTDASTVVSTSLRRRSGVAGAASDPDGSIPG
jgi:hypothetical protein